MGDVCYGGGGGGVMEERGAVDCAVCGYVGVRKRERLSVFEREKVCVCVLAFVNACVCMCVI